MANRDLQSEIAVLVETDTITASAPVSAFTAIDTWGFGDVSFAVALNRALTLPADVTEFTITESDDNVTYTAVADDKVLPVSGQTDQMLINPVSPYKQTFGVISNKRYVKPVLTGTATLTADLIATVVTMMKPLQRAFVGFKTGNSDGQP